MYAVFLFALVAFLLRVSYLLAIDVSCTATYFFCALLMGCPWGCCSPRSRVCSPCQFLLFGTAHIFLLGLLIDFWAQWLPSKKTASRPEGPSPHCVLPKAVRDAISNRQSHILLTELFTKPHGDITKYAAV